MEKTSTAKSIYQIVIIGLCCALFSCSQEDVGKDMPYIKVNDFSVTAEDVDTILKFEAKLDTNLYISEDTKVEFVEKLIEKQVILQEAKRRKLDERELFRQTLQRYWESTLIRDLLAERAEEIRKSTVITDSELLNYYEANKQLFDGESFQDVSEELAEVLEDKKVTEILNTWIEGLKQSAKIEINDPELERKILKEKPQ